MKILERIKGFVPRYLNATLGVWLMIAPAALTYERPAAMNDRIVGPLIATFAVVAIWEATRPCRWINVAAGAWLLVAPWILGYDVLAPTFNSILVGIAVLSLGLVNGELKTRFGYGWSVLWPLGRSDGSPRQRELFEEGS